MSGIKSKSNRMEELLQYYEDKIWIISTILPYSSQDNSILEMIPDPMLLRRSLEKSDYTQVIQQYFDLVKLSKSAPQLVWFEMLHRIQYCVIEWIFGSRRMYGVSENLVNMLLETDLPDFIPREIKMIAPAFAIVLDKPITLKGGRQYDLFVVSSSGSDGKQAGVREFLTISAFTKQYGTRMRYSQSDKKNIVKSLKINPESYSRIFDKDLRRNRGCHIVGFSINPEDVNRPYNKFIMESCNNDDKTLFQIGMGLNLYLQSARQGDIEKVSRVTLPRTERGKSIVEGAELFDLSVSKVFVRPYDKSGNSSGNKVRPHFRRGFWRRPRGYGEIPGAIATEWVRPTWVHKERITDGEHPVGAIHKV